MKKLLLSLIGALAFVNVLAQAPAIQWSKSLGGSSRESVYGILPTPDGGTIVLGSTNSTNGNVVGLHGTSGWFDFWVNRLDSSGNIVWNKTYGGTSTDIAYDIKATADGGYLICGYAISNDGDVSGNHGGTADAWVIKIDYAGTLLWQKCYGGTALDKFRKLYATSDGGFIAVGSTLSNDGDVSGHYNTASTDEWVVKADSVGNLQWQRCLGGTNWDDAYGVIQMNDNTFWVAGEAWSIDNQAVGNHGYYDYLLVHLDTNGTVLTSKIYGGSDQEFCRGLIKTDSGFLAYGLGSSTTGNVIGNNGNYDYWVIGCDTAGTIIWQKCLGGTGSDGADFATRTPDNGFIFSGYSASNNVNVTGNHGGNDAWIVKTDSVGNLQWQRSFGGTAADESYAVAVSDNNDIYVTATTLSLDGDITGNHGGPDEIWVAKLGSNYNLITGSIYADFNGNGVRDTNDIGIQNKMVTESTTGRVGVTDANGYYEIPVFGAGNYTVVPPAVTNYQPTPATQSPVFANTSTEIDSLNDFGYVYTNPNTRDWMIRMLLWNSFRPGFSGLFSFDVYNFGSLPEAGTVTIYGDTGVVFDSCNFAGAMVYPDSIVVPIPTQQPLTFRWIIVGYHVLASTALNTPITLVGHVEPSNGDVNTLNNTDTLFSTVTGAFDPNDITSNVDKLYNYQIPQHPELKYLIRFQNTGNDTAFNIVVVDTLSPLLNPASVKLLSSSHPVQMDYNSLYRTLKFTFSNILLVDSNHNEPLSHGAVSFTVEPNTNVYAGDVINASANIYFDYNAAVRTNDWEIPVIIPMAVQQYTSEVRVSIYPNPVSSPVTIALQDNENIEQVTVYSLLGQELMQINNVHSPKYSLDLNPLKEGMYLMKIQTGAYSISKTIIKK